MPSSPNRNLARTRHALNHAITPKHRTQLTKNARTELWDGHVPDVDLLHSPLLDLTEAPLHLLLRERLVGVWVDGLEPQSQL